MGEKGVGKLSRETPPPREGDPMGAEGVGWWGWEEVGGGRGGEEEGRGVQTA